MVSAFVAARGEAVLVHGLLWLVGEIGAGKEGEMNEQVHFKCEKIGDETLGLSVYADKSAMFSIVCDKTIQCMRTLDPSEDGSDIAFCGAAKEWFDMELAAGRKAAP